VIAAIIARLVDFSRRHAAINALAALALTLVAGWYAAGHLSIDTDIEKLLPSNLPWRQNEIALDRAFPKNANLLAIVIDGATGDLTDDAAQRLADKLTAEPQLFHNVRRPDGGAFFDRNGLLFLSVDALNALSDQLIAAQPLIGSLSADPSLRGLFNTLKLFVEGATRGDVGIDKLDPTLGKIAEIIDGVAAGRPESLSWQQVLTGTKPDPHELRKFVLAQPVLDYNALEPGLKATDEIRRLAAELGLTPQAGVRVRITGSVALDDDQFAALRKGALRSALLSVGSVLVILLLGLRSPRLVIAILATVTVGLVLTGGFAALAIGSLNLISVAFGVLFVGLAVDFSIQFSVRYRDQRHRLGTLDAALSGAARTIGRDRWEDLKKLFNGPKRVDRAREIVVSEEFAAADSVGRFGLLWKKLKAGGTVQRKKGAPASLSAWEGRDKQVAASWRATNKTFSLSLSETDAREFGAYISSRLDGLYEAFRQARASTTTGD